MSSRKTIYALLVLVRQKNCRIATVYAHCDTMSPAILPDSCRKGSGNR